MVTTHNWRDVPERSCANDDVICVITSAIEDNYIPIEQLSFQSAAIWNIATPDIVVLYDIVGPDIVVFYDIVSQTTIS